MTRPPIEEIRGRLATVDDRLERMAKLTEALALEARRVKQETAARLSSLEDQNKRLREALEGLVHVIAAGGPLQLSAGVEIGRTSWLVKCNNAMNFAFQVLQQASDTPQETGRTDFGGPIPSQYRTQETDHDTE